MSDSISIRQTVNSLVKVAEQMVDAVEGQEQQKLSPEEALAKIEEIISALEQVASGIPAESAPQEQEPVETAPQTEAPQAPVEEEEKKPDPRIAQLEKQVATLTAQAEDKDRDVLAEKIAQFYDNPEEKFTEIKSAKESLPILQAKLDTLTELTGKIGLAKVAKTETVNLQHFAKKNNGRIHTIGGY